MTILDVVNRYNLTFFKMLGRNSMSKFNVGDKFEIEIAEVFKGAESGNDKYRIKGFDNLVFDDKGLEKMKQTKKNEPKRLIEVGDIVRCTNGSYGVIVKLLDDGTRYSVLDCEGMMHYGIWLTDTNYTVTGLKSNITDLYERLQHIDDELKELPIWE